ncbi:MAG: helix-turn-helix transcriptional regulator, partial [Lutibacter sp.]|nr:helix-turn-helix transcriptional regulator [Lutibacter sp.]
MVNIEQFAKRLNILMDYYEISAALLAEKIEVQRSSISHILSGRNKPSLEFVLKILKAFPEVELYWLLNGVGNFPKQVEVKTPSPTLFS